MKVLQVCAYAAPYGGNFIKSLLALAEEASADGCQTIFCFPEINRKLEWCKTLEQTFKVYYLPLAHARLLPSTYRKLKKIFTEHPDIAYAHSHFELYDSPLALVAPKDVKLFWHLHDAIGSYLHGIYKLVWKCHYSLFSKRVILISVSEKHKRIVEQLGFPEKNSYYEPNAIDTERIKLVPKNRCTTNDFLIFGWDYCRKGVDIAEKAIELVKNDAILNIVGSPEEKKSQYQGYTIIHTKSSSDINAIFSSTKCFLHISRAEGLSYALLEALYAGLPVIVSDIEENLIAKEFPTAIIVKSESVEEITKTMSDILSRTIDFNDKAIETSRKLIEESYSIQAWAKHIYSDYKHLQIR